MTYDEHRAILIAYLKAKIELSDWHGVSDAANDLRVLEATPQIGMSRQERDQAAFDRIAERIQAEERGTRHPSASWAGVSNPTEQPDFAGHARSQVAQRHWWRRLLRWLGIAHWD